MVTAGRRPMGRLCYWAIAVAAAASSAYSDFGGSRSAEWSAYDELCRILCTGGRDAAQRKPDHLVAGLCDGGGRRWRRER